MNIPHYWQKIKTLLTGELFVVCLIIFVGLLSFALGRLSVEEQQRMPVQILKTVNEAQDSAQTAGAAASGGSIESQFVASKNGTKYHFPWCSSAQRIKEENKIYFASQDEAKRAGYSPAANCKGL